MVPVRQSGLFLVYHVRFAEGLSTVAYFVFVSFRKGKGKLQRSGIYYLGMDRKCKCRKFADLQVAKLICGPPTLGSVQ
jgi:hypothetical protein